MEFINSEGPFSSSDIFIIVYYDDFDTVVIYLRDLSEDLL